MNGGAPSALIERAYIRTFSRNGRSECRFAEESLREEVVGSATERGEAVSEMQSQPVQFFVIGAVTACEQLTTIPLAD